MTDRLQDLLDRIADDAGPGPADPTLWARARRARQLRRRRRALAGVAAGVAAVVALTVVGNQGQRHPVPEPVDQPDRRSAGSGIPSVVYGVPGDGGLDLETDLAVGPASAVVTNVVGAYVVTAEDGVYHRVRLPGYDAASYDAGLPGAALSPDGVRLAYGFRSTAARPDGRPLRTGLRVVDLTTGAVWTERFHGRSSIAGDLNVFAWDLRWSPDSRYLGASVAIHEVAGQEHWYALLEPAEKRIVREMWHSKQWPDRPMPVTVSSAGRVTVVDTDPRYGLATWVDDGWRLQPLATPALSTGRFSPDGRWLAMAGDGPRSEIAVLDAGGSGAAGSASPSSPTALPERRYPHGAAVDLLAWTGDRQVVALLRPGIGPGTVGVDADLAVLTVGPDPDFDVVGRVLVGDTQSAFSFATDFVTARSPTRAFDPPPFAKARR